MGHFNIMNALMTLAVMGIQGLSLADMQARIAALNPVVGRMQLLGELASQPCVVVDYAHTPDALARSLQAVREHATGRVWCVFGCGGERDRGKRAMMAALAETHADEVVVTLDNPRDEPIEVIMQDIRQGFVGDAVVEKPDRKQAIAYAVQSATIGDVVLIAGKGHESTQIIAGQQLEHSDIEVSLACLRAYHS